MYTTIISTADLFDHLQDADWVIVDCRFDLSQPEWGFTNYQQAHIPGSVYAHLDKDLAGPITSQTGRHPLPDINSMAERLGRWGISQKSQVIVYDTTEGAYAVRLWWLLRWMGHTAVAVLDGGFGAWLHENKPVSSGIESRSEALFIPHPDWTMAADTEEVDRIRQDPNYRLVDARTPERYRGENEPIDPVAGHITGAINRFYGANLTSDGTFLPPQILRKQFIQLIGETPPENVVVYCGSGVTSIHHILAMEIAGLSGARLYPGSWSEWIRDEKRQIN